MFKISDFKLAHTIIRTACRSRGVSFLDLPVEFLSASDTDRQGYQNGKIMVVPRKSLSGTVSSIVFQYLDNFQALHKVKLYNSPDQSLKVGSQIQNLLSMVFLSKLTLNKALPDSPVSQRLYQYRLPSILLKDFVCPIYNKKFNNVKVITYGSAFLDGSKVLTDKDFEGNEKYSAQEFPFLFLNFDVLYEPCKMAHLFISALEAHGFSPRETVQDLLESEMKDKFIGLVQLEYIDDSQAEDFFAFLCTFLDIEDKTDDLLVKNAQANQNSGPMQMGGMDGTTTWWYLGLIEKMLDPVRGQDWSTHHVLEKMRGEIWDKIELEKERLGVHAIPYESMLRVRDGEIAPEDVAIMEKVLSSDRIW